MAYELQQTDQAAFSGRHRESSHHVILGYIFWIFGFTGSHRFFFGKPLTGILWFFTGGLLGIGWIIDLFLIPSMAKEADRRFFRGGVDYNLAWCLLLPLGIFGLHRFYLGKWISGLLFLCTGGFFGIGIIHDVITLNDQILQLNLRGE